MKIEKLKDLLKDFGDKVKFDYDLYKIGNKTENKKRPYGYDVEYQNVDIDTLLKNKEIINTDI